jgi:hypothetical protein
MLGRYSKKKVGCKTKAIKKKFWRCWSYLLLVCKDIILLYRVIIKKRPSLYLTYLKSDFNERYIKLKGSKSTINWI